ncbi:unnamed protein product (macronuclear) [Paramecium tetraurelia]|uniref:THH1/TOM1/TOM3 domain-containing protein n=1 Tax=Paramecium tetraurelia TaxID=5888 RepID=A0DV24_PARTE|nr:uncharacterized protein GSPATT00020553001 [Paramecium tetraurelia]CAK86891.1 unnamed protein product [Paramecium tetraurelia]|eukprot:XP_001454288.1 hypothetical protein (macronuclear) [Paramecium tetraurelia strain d4-2]
MYILLLDILDKVYLIYFVRAIVRTNIMSLIGIVCKQNDKNINEIIILALNLTIVAFLYYNFFLQQLDFLLEESFAPNLSNLIISIVLFILYRLFFLVSLFLQSSPSIKLDKS